MNDSWFRGEAIVRALVARALKKGAWVIVEDEEEDYRISRSQDGIVSDATATDMAWLHFYPTEEAKAGTKLGTVLVIPGNGCDTITDHTDNEAMAELVAGLDESNAADLAKVWSR